MRILILVPHQNRISGNWVTASRFQIGLEKHGHQVALHDTSLPPNGSLKRQLRDFDPDICILLHAYRTGKPWLEEAKKDLPCLVVLTGTDVNQGLDDPQQSSVIRSILDHSAYVLLQNSLILGDLRLKHPELTSNLRLLPPGITLGQAPYDIRTRHKLPQEQTLFLCPAGLRPVKGVLPLLKMFDQVAVENSNVHLAFCGPVLDEGYGREVLAAIEARPWASYLGTIPTEAMASAMRGTDVILNNSHTEGLANSLLEAATLGIPILAHRIPGNAAIVKPDINGLMYDNETEFGQYARQLLRREKRQQLSRPDPCRYHPDKETAELISLLQRALDGPSRERAPESQTPGRDRSQDSEADREAGSIRRA